MYEFTRLKLERDEFENLVFMGYPRPWAEDKERHGFLLDICYKPLNQVVKKVIEESGLVGNDLIPVKVFDSIDIIVNGEKDPWFRRHAHLSLSFSKGLMDKLWVRNLAPHERKCSPNGTFYMEDGNHRALVYAMHIELGKAIYEPVNAIHATSWDIANGILGHPMQPMSVLEHSGKLQYDKDCEGKHPLSNGIQINTYRRN